MSLEDKLHKMALEKRPALAQVALPSTPAPVDETGDTLDLDGLFQECDAKVPAGAQGSSPEEVVEALRPFFDLDQSNRSILCSSLSLAFTMSSFRGVMCAGVGMCRRCGNYQSPIGPGPGVVNVKCQCEYEYPIRILEYSHRVGKQIRELLKQHEGSLSEVKCAYQLHQADNDAEATAIMLKVVRDFQERGNRPAEAEALGLVGRFRIRIEPIQARAFLIDGLKIWIELKDISGIAKALFDFATIELNGQRRTFVCAVLRLLEDVCNRHEATHETQKQLAQALFLEAAAMSYSATTVAEAREKLVSARRYLTEAAQAPGGMKLLAIAERFDFVQQKLTKVQTFPADLAERAGAALKAEQLESANRFLVEAASACAGIGDLASLKQVVNQLVLVSFKRQELATALSHLETMEWVCRELRAEKDLAITLKNRAEILKVFEDSAMAAEIASKTAEAQQIDQRLQAAKDGIPHWRAAAEKAIANQAWKEAIVAWQSIANAAQLLGEELEHMQALTALADCQGASGDHASGVFTLLELEALTEGREPLPFFGQALMTQAAFWANLGDPDIAAGRLARAALSWSKVQRLLPDNLSEPEVREFPQKKRNECLGLLRGIGDERAGRADWSGAQKIYRLTVCTGEDCLTAMPRDFGLLLTQICNVDELGVTIAKQSSASREEGCQFVQQAMTMLDALDREEPSGTASRTPIRQEISAHLEELREDSRAR